MLRVGDIVRIIEVSDYDTDVTCCVMCWLYEGELVEILKIDDKGYTVIFHNFLIDKIRILPLDTKLERYIGFVFKDIPY